MHVLQKIGLFVFLTGLVIFCTMPFFGSFNLKQNDLEEYIGEKGYHFEVFQNELKENVVNREFSSAFQLTLPIMEAVERSNEHYRNLNDWDQQALTFLVGRSCEIAIFEGGIG